MTDQTVVLYPTEQLRWGPVKFIAMHVQDRDELPPLVRLSVSSGGTRSYHHLEPGDTVTVADQEWRLDRVENLGVPDKRWAVVLTRVR